MLRELAELAMDGARRAHAALAAEPVEDRATNDQATGDQATGAQTTGDQATGDRASAGLLFTRLARAVRQTVALDARLAAAVDTAATAAAAEQARRARTEARRRDHRRAEIRRRLTHTIRDSADPSDADSLLADLDDRLEDADIHAALDHTPITRIVAGLCAEWGITPNLAHWSDEELAAAATPPLPP